MRVGPEVIGRRAEGVDTWVLGHAAGVGKQALTTVKTQASKDQTEAYHVTKDPLELVNLVHSTDPTIQATISQLDTLLHQQCKAKMLKPSSGTVPGPPDR